MNQYKAPKTNPSNHIHVAGAMTMEMTEEVYSKAKLQNYMRWILVFVLSVCTFFYGDYIGIETSYRASCGVGIATYFILSKILPLANLTSTTKFKKYGDQLKMDKMSRKLGIGKYAKKED